MWWRVPFVLVVVLGLTACNFQPLQSHTYHGQACHPVGYSWSPVWVAPNGHSAC